MCENAVFHKYPLLPPAKTHRWIGSVGAWVYVNTTVRREKLRLFVLLTMIADSMSLLINVPKLCSHSVRGDEQGLPQTKMKNYSLGFQYLVPIAACASLAA